MLDATNLSLQLYTVRAAMKDDLDRTLERIAELGYQLVEPYSFVTFAGLADSLTRHGLSAPTAHMGLLGADLGPIFEAAARIGIETVIAPSSDRGSWSSAAYVTSVADELNAAAEKAAGYGLTVGYHNHWWELEERLGGKHGLEVLVENLAPEVVLEVDTYWAHVGGADVPALLGRLGDRVAALHIKDGDGSRDNTNQVAVGSGVIPVWDFIKASPSMKYGVVELDDTSGDVFEAVGDSLSYLLAGKDA
ncbi:sugar phosphate isomerase/epimerase [Kribbella pittospori]|uniref:Sugar phosphate isomerase/epimerase n=1 Tax=Kribbella pittospori TaxID=722689 RepID=A0A4R0JWN4_9ACTN|nr:sugar phosphate isomerase/epimerase [Kribbella pittospori]TCC51469.1 sugar phosphate isomerase/epimerase [Kribbella pittospori]